MLKRFNFNCRQVSNRCLNNNWFKWLKSSVARCSRVINIYSRTSNLNRSNDSWNLMNIAQTGVHAQEFLFFIWGFEIEAIMTEGILILTSCCVRLSWSCTNRGITCSWPCRYSDAGKINIGHYGLYVYHDKCQSMVPRSYFF